jgi:hypothetical protein
MYYQLNRFSNINHKYSLFTIYINKNIFDNIINNFNTLNIYIDYTDDLLKNKYIIKYLIENSEISSYDVRLKILKSHKIYDIVFNQLYKYIDVNHKDTLSFEQKISKITKNNKITDDIIIFTSNNKLQYPNINSKYKIHILNFNFETEFIDYYFMNDNNFFFSAPYNEVLEYLNQKINKIDIFVNYNNSMIAINSDIYEYNNDYIISILANYNNLSDLKLIIYNNKLNIKFKSKQLTNNNKILSSLLAIKNLLQYNQSLSVNNLYNSKEELYFIINLYIECLSYNNELNDHFIVIEQLIIELYFDIILYTNKYINIILHKLHIFNDSSYLLKYFTKYTEIENKYNSIKSYIINEEYLNDFINIKNNLLLLIQIINNLYQFYQTFTNNKIIYNLECDVKYSSIINHSYWYEEINNHDILGLVFLLNFDNDTIIIKDVSLSTIFFSELIELQLHYYNYNYRYDNGDSIIIDDKEINHAIFGNGIGSGNAIIPLYIANNHFSKVKLLYKYVISYNIYHDMLCYSNKYFFLPLLVLYKMNYLLFYKYKLSHKAIEIWLQLYLTCKNYIKITKANHLFNKLLKKTNLSINDYQILTIYDLLNNKPNNTYLPDNEHIKIYDALYNLLDENIDNEPIESIKNRLYNYFYH